MASANALALARGVLLKRAGRAEGLTQKELAARSGVSVHTISGLARQTRAATLALLADVLALAPAARAAFTAAGGRQFVGRRQHLALVGQLGESDEQFPTPVAARGMSPP